MELPCGSPSAESEPRTRNRTAAPKNSWCSGVRSAHGGMPVSETSSVSAPNELRQQCEAPLRRHGPGVGGPCWPCRCNKPSRAQPLGQLGRPLSTRADSRPCSTLLMQQGRTTCRYAACRVGTSGGPVRLMPRKRTVKKTNQSCPHPCSFEFSVLACVSDCMQGCTSLSLSCLPLVACSVVELALAFVCLRRSRKLLVASWL